MKELLETMTGFVWSPALLIPLLLATSSYLTVVVRGLQFRRLGRALWLALALFWMWRRNTPKLFSACGLAGSR